MKANQPPAKSDPAIRQIRHHARQLVRELDIVKGIYLDTGCTFSQCHVLFELSSRSSMNLMELADALLMDKSNTSRTVKKLTEMGLVQMEKVDADQRQKQFSLTREGDKVLRSATRLADERVARALQLLDQEQQSTVIEGLQLYAGALRKSRLQANYEIRSIQKKDNVQVARLIREVMTEFQAVGPGYSIDDPEVDDMYGNYRDRKSAYFVIVQNGQVAGGGGIGPLRGGDTDVCELRKMFFRPELRGLGMGQRLLQQLMNEARKRGYLRCYLETLDRMWQANQLYRRFGFQLLEQPRGQTGHTQCDRWYELEL